MDGLDEHHRPARRAGQVDRQARVVAARQQAVLQRRGVGHQQHAALADVPHEEQGWAPPEAEHRPVARG
ncbi:MAG: hypothetical protein ACR2KV_15425, partial [Solirubrobacteraceae bacterium]